MAAAAPSYPLASLYVGDLHPDITEAMLFEMFSTTGSVLSIRVCRDMHTRKSLGYAYVNFQHPADAERAMDTMNYEVLRGKPMRIMWSQSDPTVRRAGLGNIFIKNLDKSIDNKFMYDIFSGFGQILSCKVATDETGQSKGYAFVHFESDQAAQSAIDKVNGMMLNGKRVFVGRFVPRSEGDREHGDQPRKFTNVFIKNLGEDLDDDKLQKLFEPFGTITTSKVMTHEDGKSKGFGFVSFQEPESAEKAVEELNGKDINGKALFVGRAQKRQEREAELRRKFEAVRKARQSQYVGTNLYVKNLDENIDDDVLKNEFSKFGKIVSAKVMRDPNNQSRGFGFVSFSSPDEANKATADMNGKVLAGKPLYVAPAQRKEERKQQIAAQMKRFPARSFRPPMYPPAPYGAVPFFNQMQRAQGYFQSMQQGMQRLPGDPMMTGSPARANGMPPNQRGGPVAAAASLRTGVAAFARPGAQPMARRAGSQQQQPAASASGIDPSVLAQASPHDQKQMLGERLFTIIHPIHRELAGKLTEMLLEMDNSDLIMLLETPDQLSEKIKEASEVLKRTPNMTTMGQPCAGMSSTAPVKQSGIPASLQIEQSGIERMLGAPIMAEHLTRGNGFATQAPESAEQLTKVAVQNSARKDYDFNCSLKNTLHMAPSIDRESSTSFPSASTNVVTDPAARQTIQPAAVSLVSNVNEPTRGSPSDQSGRILSSACTKLYVAGFGREMDEMLLWELFEPFGDIDDAYIVRDYGGFSRGFAFVTFRRPTDAQMAIRQLNGKHVGTTKCRLYVDRAKTRAETKAPYSALSTTSPQRSSNGSSTESSASQLQKGQKPNQQAVSAIEKKVTNDSDKKALLCVVCFDRSVEVILKPCNHISFCKDCTKGIKECHICRKPVESVETVFIDGAFA